MPWWQFALLGAGGGAIVEGLGVFRCAAVWQDARLSLDGRVKNCPPELRSYVDVRAHAIVLSARILLGTVAAVLYGVTGQVNWSLTEQ